MFIEDFIKYTPYIKSKDTESLLKRFIYTLLLHMKDGHLYVIFHTRKL